MKIQKYGKIRQNSYVNKNDTSRQYLFIKKFKNKLVYTIYCHFI